MNRWPEIVSQQPKGFRIALDDLVSSTVEMKSRPPKTNKEMGDAVEAIEKSARTLLERIDDLRVTGDLPGLCGIGDDPQNTAARQFMKDNWNLTEDELNQADIGTNLWQIQYPLLGLGLYMQILHEHHAGVDSRNSFISRHVIRRVVELCSKAGMDLLSRKNGDPVKQVIRYAFDNINTALGDQRKIKTLSSEWYGYRKACAKYGHGIKFYQWTRKQECPSE